MDRPPALEPRIPVEDFFKVDVRVGRIIEAAPFERARKPSYQLRVDFGPERPVREIVGAADYCGAPFESVQMEWLVDSVLRHRVAA